METQGIDPGELQSILSIGHDASLRGAGRSLRNLLAATRYRELRPRISEPALATALREDPATVDVWLRYSEDKRTSAGWYFTRQLAHWTVGRLRPPKADRFSTGEEGCAAFIVRELDFWVGVPDDPPPLAAARFHVDRLLNLGVRPGFFVAGVLVEGTVEPGMMANILIDGDLLLTSAIQAVEYARIAGGEFDQPVQRGAPVIERELLGVVDRG